MFSSEERVLEDRKEVIDFVNTIIEYYKSVDLPAVNAQLADKKMLRFNLDSSAVMMPRESIDGDKYFNVDLSKHLTRDDICFIPKKLNNKYAMDELSEYPENSWYGEFISFVRLEGSKYLFPVEELVFTEEMVDAYSDLGLDGIAGVRVLIGAVEGGITEENRISIDCSEGGIEGNIMVGDK